MEYMYLLLNTRPERVGYLVSCGTCQSQRLYWFIWSSSYAKYAEKFCGHGKLDAVDTYSKVLCLWTTLPETQVFSGIVFYMKPCLTHTWSLFDTWNLAQICILIPVLSLQNSQICQEFSWLQLIQPKYNLPLTLVLSLSVVFLVSAVEPLKMKAMFLVISGQQKCLSKWRAIWKCNLTVKTHFLKHVTSKSYQYAE